MDPEKCRTARPAAGAPSFLRCRLLQPEWPRPPAARIGGRAILVLAAHVYPVARARIGFESGGRSGLPGMGQALGRWHAWQLLSSSRTSFRNRFLQNLVGRTRSSRHRPSHRVPSGSLAVAFTRRVFRAGFCFRASASRRSFLAFCWGPRGHEGRRTSEAMRSRSFGFRQKKGKRGKA